MIDFKTGSIKSIDKTSRSILLRNFLIKNNLMEEVNQDIVYGPYTIKKVSMPNIITEEDWIGWNYLGMGISAFSLENSPEGKPNIIDNEYLQFLVCEAYGIETLEDFLKDYKDLQGKKVSAIEKKEREIDKLAKEICRLQNLLLELEAEVNIYKRYNKTMQSRERKKS